MPTGFFYPIMIHKFAYAMEKKIAAYFIAGIA
jgi:hypothetical protein